MGIRQRVHQILDPDHSDGFLGRFVNYLIYALIFLNVAAIVAESMSAVHATWAGAFHHFEVFSVAVFSVEYLLRVWSCVESPRYAAPLAGRLRYMLSPLGLLDLLAILPFYLPFVTADMLFLRAARFFRLFRVFKLGRYSTAFRVMARVVHAKRAELLMSLFIIALLTVISATCMYYAESEAQPTVFADIPSSMFWALAALTSVGHADPVTPLGKALASIVYVLGVGMLALPTGILGAGFVEEFQARHRPPLRCPHCGKEIG
jgi:voltage-gated potassium channel